jgi:hypothetical protein
MSGEPFSSLAIPLIFCAWAKNVVAVSRDKNIVRMVLSFWFVSWENSFQGQT